MNAEDQSAVIVNDQEMDLYRALLSYARAGPEWKQIEAIVGAWGMSLHKALLDRVDRRRATGGRTSFELDEVDRLAIRLLAPVIIEVASVGDFHLVTGHEIEKVPALLEKVEQARREIGFEGGRSYRVGRCLLTLPSGTIATNVAVVAVPDAASWDRVVPPCARGRRDEFLGPMRRYFATIEPVQTLWEERTVDRYEDLVAWVEQRTYPFGQSRVLAREKRMRASKRSRQTGE